MNTLEVFTYRQYSDTTLERLHSDLRKNRLTFMDATEESLQFARVREEMERRGMTLKNYNERKTL